MAVGYKHPRGTKANLDSLAGSNGLAVGQVYVVTDQGGRLAFATATNAYVFAQQRGISGLFTGVPTASQTLMASEAPYPFSLTAANCRVSASVAATASAVCTIRNGTTNIGTATFAAAGTLATISISTPAVAKWDLINVLAPASPDATLANIRLFLGE